MGSTNGFLKKERALPGTELPKERVQHFNEFFISLPVTHAEDQASRCMDCGVPFCHSGCPLGNLIPDFNDAVYMGEWKEAYKILSQTNNFPEFTGRICPAPCESSCVLSINKNPVAIEYIEKTIIETAFKNGWVSPTRPLTKTDKKVAIVGSGPAGLACAAQLNKAGHTVTVYERADRLGGLLRYGIPDFKLDKQLIDRRIKLMEDSGITFVTKTNVGIDIPVEQLKSQYDAIVLCGGSTIHRDLKLPGHTYKGIIPAMDFLTQNNKVVAGDQIPEDQIIEVKNYDVIVIGGGDTGSDCIGTSNRLGAKSVTQIEILDKPPTQRKDTNPWPNWPMTLRTSSSHEEGCTREWAILTKRYISNDGINLSGIEVVNVRWEKSQDGKYQMIEDADSKRILPCSAVFLALGFIHPQKQGLLDILGVDLDKRGNVLTRNYATSVENIFSAGDMRRGQSLVVWAISEGREAAIAVDEFLCGNKSQLASKAISVLSV
jgi:glutamate synthase (NADPH/NADH) small chain